MRSRSCHERTLLLALSAALLLVVPAPPGARPAHAQEVPADSLQSDSTAAYILNPLNITATRALKRIFLTAAPVSVVGRDEMDRLRPTNAADAIAGQPGVDVNGVGANQQRPTIRGQRGQRILLLEDGLRLNNARRQADFGELPAIVDIGGLERIEVVRGPASVLYGSDAIGGVVNLKSERAPARAAGDVFGGELNFTYRSAGEQVWPSATVHGRRGAIGFLASGSVRNTEDYDAASGTFGDVTLTEDVTVNGTGVEDRNFGLHLEADVGEHATAYAKISRYEAEDAGFGFVANEDLGLEDGVSIDIRYPDQGVTRVRGGIRATSLELPVADRIDASLFFMDNERDFVFDVVVPFGAPGTGVFSNQQNFTDLETFGLRIETAKLFAGRHVLTYGLDYYHDDSHNTDLVESTVIPFPGATPETTVDDTPTVPFATYDKFGAFAQADIELGDRAAVIFGGRWQRFSASPQPTPGITDLPGEASENTAVVAANGLVTVAEGLNLVATVGRGFRAPNLIELFFNGAVPEGNGFQVANPSLEPEKSWNVDAGFKFRRQAFALEAFYFRTWLSDGIRISPTGGMVGPFPAFQNVNVDRLTLQGVELLAEARPIDPLTVGVTYTWLDGSDEEDDQNNPTSDTYSSRVTGDVTYREPGGRWWAQYQVRHNGEQSDADFVIASPIGDVIPSFTVMHLRAGARLFDFGSTSHNLTVGIENLTDQLYAEFSNATFFRPAPRRALLVGWTTTF